MKEKRVAPLQDARQCIVLVSQNTEQLNADATRRSIRGFRLAYTSCLLQVATKTPPAFLIHTGEDKVVVADNSNSFNEVLRHNAIPLEMYIFPEGDHGFV